MTKTKALKRRRGLVMPKDREALLRRAGEEADGCISVGGLAYGSDRLRRSAPPRAAADQSKPSSQASKSGVGGKKDR